MSDCNFLIIQMSRYAHHGYCINSLSAGTQLVRKSKINMVEITPVTGLQDVGELISDPRIDSEIEFLACQACLSRLLPPVARSED